MADKTSASSVVVEPQAKIAPAFSATSDMPVKVEAPAATAADTSGKDAKTEDTKLTETVTDPEAKKADGDVKEVKPEEGDDPLKSDKTPPWMKAVITKERNKARSEKQAREVAERRADENQAMLKRALDNIESLTKREVSNVISKTEKEDPRPQRESFDSPEAYDTALIDWSARRASQIAAVEAQNKIEADAKAKKESEEKLELERQNAELADAFIKRKTTFMEDHPDYEELVESDSLQISMPMASYIMNDEDGPAVAYYLGQNPDESERISKLPPVRAIAELGRISARLAAKPIPPKPDPIVPIKTASATAVRKTAHEESMDEYAARRQSQINAERRQRLGLAN